MGKNLLHTYTMALLIVIPLFMTSMAGDCTGDLNQFTSSMADDPFDGKQTGEIVSATNEISATVMTNDTHLDHASYVGGDMVERFEMVNHTKIPIGILASESSKIERLFTISQRYAVSTHSSLDTFYTSLNHSGIAAVSQFPNVNSSDTEMAMFSKKLIQWAGNGNLLVMNNMSNFDEADWRSLGIGLLETQREDAVSTRHIQFGSPGVLTHNRPRTTIELNGSLTCFSEIDLEIAEPVAFINTPNATDKYPCAVLSTLDKGFVLTFGFNFDSVSSSDLRVLQGVLENVFEIYSMVHFSLQTEPVKVLNPSSPHLHVLQENSSRLYKIKEAVSSLALHGFNAYGSNLLYADYDKGYYGHISFHGSLQSFIRMFSGHIQVKYDSAPRVVLSNTTLMPAECAGIFSRIEPQPIKTLCWPSGWGPPNVPYYHLAPTKQYSDDMGSDQWLPQSVEEVIRADDARNFGYDGSDVEVAMVDTGFSRNRPGEPYEPNYPTELGYHPYYEEYWVYKDLLQNRYTAHSAGGYHPDEDFEGHGTAIASNLFAVAPGITFHFIPYYDEVDAFNVLLSVEPDIVTCSWAYTTADVANPTLQSQLRQLSENGVIVLFAAGNTPHGELWPANEPCVVSVGGAYVDSDESLQASDYALSITSTTFKGRVYPDVCGLVGMQPGGHLIEMPTEPGSDMDYTDDGTYQNDGWCVASGTSSATPQVAGLAALAKQHQPDLNVGRFKHIVMTTCTDIVTGQSATGHPAIKGFDLATGAGLIDCYRAIKTMVQYSSSDIYEGKTSPAGKYINFYSFTGPHGLSYHADTAGSGQYGYRFFGYLRSRDGAVMTRLYDGSAGWFRIAGWFRQYDTFSSYYQPGRRYLDAYILSVDSNQIIQSVRILDHDDGTGWTYVDSIVTGLPEYGMVRVAFGRKDAWSHDWQLTAEWADVRVYSYDGWWPTTVPDGYHYRWGSSLAPEAYMGNTYRIDTIGSSDCLYYFFGQGGDYNPYLEAGTEISIAGWFRQDDTFSPSYQPGRRYLTLYVFNHQWEIKASFRILEYYDGTDWVYRRWVFEMPTNLPSDYYYIGIGRRDSWSSDWHLTAEWNNVQLVVNPSF